MHTPFKPDPKTYSSSWVWPQAEPAFIASLFSSVKWNYSPKAPGDLVYAQGRIVSRELPLCLGSCHYLVPGCVQSWRGMRVTEGRWTSPANPGFLQETETDQRGGAFLIELKGGVGRFQKPPRVAKSRVFNSNEVGRSSGFRSWWPPKEGDRPEPMSTKLTFSNSEEMRGNWPTGLAWNCGVGKGWSSEIGG